MEQHYIITFGISNESMNSFYTMGVIIKQYPGDPTLLLREIFSYVEKNSRVFLGRYIDGNSVSIKQLTKVN